MILSLIKNYLLEKISRISTADLKDGGEGAFYIFFKKIKKSIE